MFLSRSPVSPFFFSFLKKIILIAQTPVGCHFHEGRGLRDGGVAHLPILMTNGARISLLDKASFILTPVAAP